MPWKMREYRCPCGLIFESLDTQHPRFANCPECHQVAEIMVSASKIREHSGPGMVSVTRGKNDDIPKHLIPKEWR